MKKNILLSTIATLDYWILNPKSIDIINNIKELRKILINQTQQRRDNEMEMLAVISQEIPLLSKWISDEFGQFTIDGISVHTSYEACVMVSFSPFTYNEEADIMGWIFYYSEYTEQLNKFKSKFKTMK